MDKKLREKIVKDIAYVRRGNAANMYNRLEVIQVMEFVGGKQSSADYLKEHPDEYMDLLVESGNY